MKKGLFLLPLIGGFVLAGCDFSLESLMFWKKSDTEQKDSGGSSGGDPQPPAETRKDPKAPESDLTIDLNLLGEFFSEGYTYPKDEFEFTLGGFSFEATSGVGQKTAEEEGGNYYYEQQVLQFRSNTNQKGAGIISNYDPIIASKITIHWFAAGYSSEGKSYQPVVKAATDPDKVASESGMTANEGATVKGTATGGKQSVSKKDGTKEDKDVYAYTTTYNITGKNYFLISAPGGAMYVKDIVINK